MEGDPKDASAPIDWPKGGWEIQPDLVMDLPPHGLPAKGVLEWESIALPAPFKSDTWLTSLEILLGEPSVIHHICFRWRGASSSCFRPKISAASSKGSRHTGASWPPAVYEPSFPLVVPALAGSMARLLGIAGIYGVIAYEVSQRRREIGIRIALGVQQRELKTMLVRDGVVLTIIGIAIRLLSSVALTLLMKAILFGISA